MSAEPGGRAIEILMRVFTARNLILMAALWALTYLAVRYQYYPRRLYFQWRYPPLEGPPEAGREILDSLETTAARKVEARYRRVVARLDEAAAEGHEVEGLRLKARAALSLNEAAYRRQAVSALQEVEMSIPRRGARPAPARRRGEATRSALPKER